MLGYAFLPAAGSIAMPEFEFQSLSECEDL